MSRANGCDAAGVAWLWAVVLAVALAVAAVALRALERLAGADGEQGADPLPAPPVLVPCAALAVVRRRCVDDPSLTLLAWLLALGWATFNGRRPPGAPCGPVRAVEVWSALRSLAPEGLR